MADYFVRRELQRFRDEHAALMVEHRRLLNRRVSVLAPEHTAHLARIDAYIAHLEAFLAARYADHIPADSYSL